MYSVATHHSPRANPLVLLKAIVVCPVIIVFAFAFGGSLRNRTLVHVTFFRIVGQKILTEGVNDALEIVFPNSVEVDAPIDVVARRVVVVAAKMTARTHNLWIRFGAIRGEERGVDNGV